MGITFDYWNNSAQACFQKKLLVGIPVMHGGGGGLGGGCECWDGCVRCTTLHLVPGPVLPQHLGAVLRPVTPLHIADAVIATRTGYLSVSPTP